MKELTLEITNRCSLNCIQCSTQASEIGTCYWSQNTFEKYLNKFDDFDVVRLSGGEPFEHPSLESFLKQIKEQNKKTIVLSSGTKEKRHFTKNEMQSVKPFLDEIVFSMHGFYDVHERIVCPGYGKFADNPYWDIMIDSFDHANQAKIYTSFQTVVMNQNFEELDDIAKSMWMLINSIKRDFNWHLLRFIKQGRGLINHNQAINEEKLNKLKEKIDIYKNNTTFINYLIEKNGSFLSELRYGHLISKHKLNITYTKSFENNKCDCGSKKAVVTFDEEIIPCSSLKNKKTNEYGNLACKGRL